MKRRIAMAALLTMAALTFVGASWQLNPLVTRRADPAGPAPLGCDESLAPSTAPRVNVAEVPEREAIVPVSMPSAPPSRSLREELDAAHRALVRNDRPTFDEHLRAARAILQSYPAGGERSRAEEVLWALNDAAVLWDAQFQSPFFDETSDAYARASRYAGYAEAVRRSVLTDDRDRRFYPAAESRDFVTRVAGERLQRLGVRGVSAPPPRVTRAEPPAAAPSTPRRVSPRPRTPRRTTSTAIASKSSKPAAPAKSAPSSSPDPSETAVPPAPAEPAPTAPPASASQASADAPASPVAGDVQAEPEAVAVSEPVPASDTATTTSATTTSEPPPAAAPAERRSVIVPALLILIGLGVLVVLFRASK